MRPILGVLALALVGTVIAAPVSATSIPGNTVAYGSGAGMLMSAVPLMSTTINSGRANNVISIHASISFEPAPEEAAIIVLVNGAVQPGSWGQHCEEGGLNCEASVLMWLDVSANPSWVGNPITVDVIVWDYAHPVTTAANGRGFLVVRQDKKGT